MVPPGLSLSLVLLLPVRGAWAKAGAGLGARMWPSCDQKEKREPDDATKRWVEREAALRNGFTKGCTMHKKCSTSLVLKATQIKLMKYHFSSIRSVKLSKSRAVLY